jgi:methionine biosynthesis protein MetW
MSEINPDNDGRYEEYWRKRGVSKHRYRYDVLAEWIENRQSVLDVGCGDGYLAAFLRDKKDARVQGIDVSEEAVRLARERGVEAQTADLEESLPFADSQFDVVIASEVIEHIVGSEKLLLEMVRVTKDDVLVTIPNTGFWRYRLALLLGHFPKQWILRPNEHLRFWTVRDFKWTLDALGLKLVDLKAGSGRRWLRDLWPSMFAEQVCYRIQRK